MLAHLVNTKYNAHLTQVPGMFSPMSCHNKMPFFSRFLVRWRAMSTPTSTHCQHIDSPEG
jgi:hypothetical protein